MTMLKDYQDIEIKKEDKKYSVTILGRGECGKTKLVAKFMTGKFTNDYTATTIERKIIRIYESPKENIFLQIFDTSGQEDYSRLRPLTIQESDYIILAYSIVDRESFLEVKHSLRDTAMRKAKPGVKMILVSTKEDLKTREKNDEMVTTQEGYDLKHEIGAAAFFQCSALTGHSINAIFKWISTDILMKENKLTDEESGWDYLCCC
ncbi:hypothetical protein NUSPORA_01497 [Nucleospora cyclopteri]